MTWHHLSAKAAAQLLVSARGESMELFAQRIRVTHVEMLVGNAWQRRALAVLAFGAFVPESS